MRKEIRQKLIRPFLVCMVLLMMLGVPAAAPVLADCTTSTNSCDGSS